MYSEILGGWKIGKLLAYGIGNIGCIGFLMRLSFCLWGERGLGGISFLTGSFLLTIKYLQLFF
jgi:hypothetical protein